MQQWINSVKSPVVSTLCDPMDYSTPGFPVHQQLPELTQTHVRRVGDAIQPSHPVVPVSSAFNISQPQDFSNKSVLMGFSFSEQVLFNFIAAVTIYSDFGAQENDICHGYHCFPIYFSCSDGIGCHDLSFLNVEF